MAAVIQDQIRKVENKLKPYLYEGPFPQYWSLVEQKTTLKREQVALGLLGVIAIYLVLGWGNDFLCNLIGFLYPVYASVLAVESKVTLDDTEWLVYWVVYSSFGFVEYIGHSFFHGLPFYWLGKCIFLIWLMVPGSKGGSQILYKQLLRPFVLKHQPNIDKSFQQANVYVSEYMASGNK